MLSAGCVAPLSWFASVFEILNAGGEGCLASYRRMFRVTNLDVDESDLEHYFEFFVHSLDVRELGLTFLQHVQTVSHTMPKLSNVRTSNLETGRVRNRTYVS